MKLLALFLLFPMMCWAQTCLMRMQAGAFHEGDVDVVWKVQEPVYVAGLSEQQISTLVSKIHQLAYGVDAQGAIRDWRKLITQALMKAHRAPQANEAPIMNGFLYLTTDTRIVAVSDRWIAIVSEGCDNEHAGCGCFSTIQTAVLALPTLQPLTKKSLFISSKLPALQTLVVKTLKHLNALDAGEEEGPEMGKFLFVPVKDGLKFYYPAYTLFCGAEGIRSVTLDWNTLKPFIDATYLADMITLSQKATE